MQSQTEHSENEVIKVNRERAVTVTGGWPMLAVVIGLFAAFPILFINFVATAEARYGAQPSWYLLILALICFVVLCGEAEVHPVINTGTLYS